MTCGRDIYWRDDDGDHQGKCAKPVDHEGGCSATPVVTCGMTVPHSAIFGAAAKCALSSGHPGSCEAIWAADASATLPKPPPKPERPLTEVRADAAVAALEGLMEAELQAKDLARFTRLGKLATMARALKQQYARRVGDLERGRRQRPNFVNIAAPGDLDIVDEYQADDENNYIQGGRIGGGGGDMQDLLREAIATAQRVSENNNKAKPAAVELHPVFELERLIDIRDRLFKDMKGDVAYAAKSRPINARIDQLLADIDKPTGAVSVPSPMIARKEPTP